MASTLMQDSTYAGLLRALGFERDEVERNAARSTAAIDDELAFVEPEIGYQGAIAQRGIRQSRRGQGLESSSYTRQLIAEQNRLQNQARSGLQLDAANRRGDIESGRASSIASLERQLAESGLSAADRLARADAQRTLG